VARDGPDRAGDVSEGRGSVVTRKGTSAEAQLLALTHALDDSIETGHCGSVAEVAQALAVSWPKQLQLIPQRWAVVGEQEPMLSKGG